MILGALDEEEEYLADFEALDTAAQTIVQLVPSLSREQIERLIESLDGSCDPDE
jgi:hypothetical protein